MVQPSFIEHLPALFKAVISLNMAAKTFNKYMFSLRILCNFFLFSTTISCISNSEDMEKDLFSKHHDLLVVVIVISIEVFVAINLSQLCDVISYLTEPFGEFEVGSVQRKIAEDYYKEVTLYGKVVLVIYIFSAPTYCLVPFILLFQTESEANGKCADLPLGWARKSGSFIPIMPVYFVSAVLTMVEIAMLFLIYLVMFYSVVKIKFTIRLILADLDNVDEYLGSSKASDSDLDGPSTEMYRREDVLIRSTLRKNFPTENRTNKLNRLEIEKARENLLNLIEGKLLKKRIRNFFEKVVERHGNAIRCVQLTDRCYRAQVMVFLEIEIIAVAMAVPQFSLGKWILKVDYIGGGVEVAGFLTLIGLLSYFGQTLLNESELLRQALFNCDWTDKPHSLRRGLLIMQIMASRPLKLTIGGIYNLGMETYGNVVRALYSYTSLIQSIE